jgi:hypothetical protein
VGGRQLVRIMNSSREEVGEHEGRACDSLSRDVHTDGLTCGAVSDMLLVLTADPPDFLAMVRLVQRAGRNVIDVRSEASLRTPLHIAALYGKVSYSAMLVSRGADIEAR